MKRFFKDDHFIDSTESGDDMNKQISSTIAGITRRQEKKMFQGLERLSNPFSKPWKIGLLAFAVSTFSFSLAHAATVTLVQQTGNYNANFVNGGGTYNPNATEMGMYANSGGVKESVQWRNFRTEGGSGGSNRSLQIGDEFEITVHATRAIGSMGFSLNASGTQGSSWANRHSESRMYISSDAHGSWFIDRSGGTDSYSYNPSQNTYRDYRFTVRVTSETTVNTFLTVDGTFHSRVYNVNLKGSAGANMNAYSAYLKDDWDGGAHRDIFWKQTTEVEDTGTVELGFFLPSGTFTPGRVRDGLAANSTSTTRANAVQIGGDSGSIVNLTSDNDFTGSVTVNANATARAGHANAFGTTAGGVTVVSGGRIEINDGISVGAEALTLNGQGISSSGALRKRTGATGSSWAGAITLGSDSRINASSSGTLTLSGNAILSSHTLYIGGDGNVTFSSSSTWSNAGKTTGDGALNKNGSGTLTLSGTHSGVGVIRLVDGGITVSSGATLTAGDTYISGSKQITFNENVTLASLREASSGQSGTASIASGKAITINGADRGTYYMNSISGAGGLTFAGTGTSRMQLFGTQSYSGNTVINSGTLGLQTGTTLASSKILIASGATFTSQSVGGGDPFNNYSVVSGQTLGGASSSGNATLTVGSQTLTLASGALLEFQANGTGSTVGKIGVTGNLTLNNNAVTVNVTGSALGAGTYTLMDCTGTLSGSPGTLTVTGSGLSSGHVASLSISGSALVLTVVQQVAPTVTTPTVSSITTAGAILGATVTSDGGAALTSRGTVWGTTANPTVNGLAEGGTAVSAFSHARSGMSVNTFYYYRGYAVNSVGTAYSADGTFWTLANIPSAPTVNNPGETTLDVTINVNGNPSSTEFSIRVGSGSQWVQTDGSVSGTEVWRTAAAWGSPVTVTGLDADETYDFYVRARNGANTVTAYSALTSGTTVTPHVWTGGGANANWTTGANWSDGAAPGASDVAIFYSGIGSGTSINIDTASSVGGILFRSTASSALTFSGSALTVGSSGIESESGSAAHTFNNNIALGAGQNWNLAADLTVGGVISGGHAITKQGSGRLTLSGNNTFTGNLNVSAGRVRLQGNANAQGAGTTVVSSGATLEINQNFTYPRPITLSSTGVGGEGGIVGFGAATLSGAITLGGNASIQRVDSGTGNLLLSGGIDAGAHTLYIETPGASREIRMTGGAFSGTKTTGDGALHKSGPGIFYLRSGTGLTGNIILEGGEIWNPPASTYAATGLLIMRNGTTFRSSDNIARTVAKPTRIEGNVTIGHTGGTGALTFSGNMDLDAVTRTITVPNANTISGIISNGGLTKVGSESVILTGANSYSGNTTISAGTLALSGSGAIASSPVLSIAADATFSVGGLATELTMGASQDLMITASGDSAPAVISTTSGKGVNLGSGSELTFSTYSSGGGAPLTVSGGGNFTMASGGDVTVTVSGGALTTGDYKLIAKASSSEVDGTVPAAGSVTVNGDGVSGGLCYKLEIISGELFLRVGTPASISGEPTAESVCTGTDATYTVTASGTSLTYQWRKNGSNISNGATGNGSTYSGATTATLTVQGAVAGDACADGVGFDVVVTAVCGSPATSSRVGLTISSGVTIDTQPTAQTACSDPGTATFTVSASGPGLTYQWRLNGSNLSNGSQGNGSTVAGATSATLSLSDLTSSHTVAAGSGYDLVVSGDCGSPETSDRVALTVNTAVAITSQPTDQTACSDPGTASYSVTATGTGLTYQWRLNGVALSNGVQGNGSTVNGATTATLSLSGLTSAHTVVDTAGYDVVVSGTSPCSPETSTRRALTVSTAVAITSQPTDQTACSDPGTASYSVTATGTGLTYQWRLNGVALSNGVQGNGSTVNGATTATLSLSGLTSAHTVADSAGYDVVVSGTSPCSPETSTRRALTVSTVVAITSQPTDQTACSDPGTASYSVTATGTGLTYQWRLNGVALSNGVQGNGSTVNGATTATLSLSGLTTSHTVADSAGYDVVVSGTSPCSPVTSTRRALTVSTAVAITAQPTDQTACSDPGTASYSVTATGTGLTYQWRLNGVALSNGVQGNGSTVSGATTATLSLSGLTTSHTVADSAGYDVVVSGTSPCSPATSTRRALTVSTAVAITSQPTDQTACETAGTASYAVTATGTGLTYQWRLNGVNLSNGVQGSGSTVSGATTATLALSDLTPSHTVAAGSGYDVVVSGTSPCGPETSTRRALTVSAASVGGTATATDSSLCSGETTTVTVTGHTGTIQWQQSDDGISGWANVTGGSGATSETYTTPALTQDRYYRAVITSGSCAPANSTVADITIDDPASIDTQPTNEEVCDGGEATFTVVGDGGSLSYQWRRRGAGWGSGYGWVITNGGGGVGLGDSTTNGTDPSGGINTGGQAWRLSNNTGATTTAVRDFPAMGVGDVFEIDMDNGWVNTSSSVGFSLRNSSGDNMVEFYFVGGGSFYTINRSGGPQTTSVPYTESGVRVTLTVTSSTTYSISVYRYVNSTPYGPFTGTFINTGSISRFRGFNAAAGSGAAYRLYFNNIKVGPSADAPFYEDDAAAYSSFSGNLGTGPVANAAPFSGATTATLTINPATSAEAGDYDVVVYNDCGAELSSTVTLTVVDDPTITTASPLPDGTNGTAYNQSLAATGGSGFSYGIEAGSLPTGLSISTGGTISGTPTANGLFTFTVGVTNSAGCFGDKAFGLTILGAAPTTQATDLTVTSSTTTTISLSWTRGNGDNVLIVARQAAAAESPTDGTSYTADADWTAAGSLGSASKVVYLATGTSVTITDLDPGTAYQFAAFEFNGSGGSESYLIGGAPTATGFTHSTEPANHGTSFTASNPSSTTIDLSWTASAGTPAPDGYLILRRLNNAPSATPSDGTGYTVGETVGDSVVAAIVTSGTSTTATGLTPERTYYFALFPFRWDGTNGETRNYKIDPTVPTAFNTTLAGEIIIDQFDDYTVSDTLNSLNGGTGWTNAWSVSWENEGSATATIQSGSRPVPDGYPATAGDHVRMTLFENQTNPRFRASRRFERFDSGRIYASAILRYDWENDGVFLGMSFLQDGAERAFSGRPLQNNRALGMDSFGGGQFMTTRQFFGGNDYLLIMMYDFDTRDFKALLYNSANQEVPDSEPGTWDAERILDIGRISYVDGIRISAGNKLGTMMFDEVRVSDTWLGLLEIDDSDPDEAPTIQTSQFQFGFERTNQFTITSWQRGNGEKVLMVASDAGAISWTPTDGVEYTTASTTYGSGQEVATDVFVIYNGDASVTSLDLAGLDWTKTYTIRAYEYNDGANGTRYLTTTVPGNPASSTPLNPPSGILVGLAGTDATDLAWQQWNSRWVMVVYNVNSAVTFTPDQGTDYNTGAQTGGTILLDGKSNLSSFNHNGLTEDDVIYYRFFSRNDNYYSAGVDQSIVLTVSEIIYDGFANSSGALHNTGGGTGWAGNWTVSATTDAGYSSGSLPGDTYAWSSGNKAVFWGDDNGRFIDGTRMFDECFTTGKVVLSWIQEHQYGGPDNYAGVRLLDSSQNVLAFIGKRYNNHLSITNASSNAASSYTLASGTGSIYIYTVTYDFETRVLSASAWRHGQRLLWDEPPLLDVVTTQTVGHISDICGLRLSVGANSDHQIGLVYFDEIRAGTNWTEVVRRDGAQYRQMMESPPLAELIFIGADYDPDNAPTKNFLTDAELADSGNKVDIAIRFNSPFGVFTTNNPASANNIFADQGNFSPNWDPLSQTPSGENALGLDEIFDFFVGTNRAEVVTGYHFNAFTGDDFGTWDVDDQFYITVSAQTYPSSGDTASAPSGGQPVPNRRAMLINYPLEFFIIDDDPDPPIISGFARTPADLVTDHDMRQGNFTLAGTINDPGSGVDTNELWFTLRNPEGSAIHTEQPFVTRPEQEGARTNVVALEHTIPAVPYADNRIGNWTATVYAADADDDRPNDSASTQRVFQVVVIDDDEDPPLLGPNPLAILVGATPAPAAALTGDLLAAWNFNNDLYPLTVGHGAGTLTTSLANPANFTSDGVTQNAVSGDPGENALTVTNSANNGSSIRFEVDMRNRSDLVMSFAASRNATGFNNNQLAWSLNGSSWTDFGTPFDPTTTLGTQTFDLSGITALNNQPAVYLRLTFGGASDEGGSMRIDNVRVVTSLLSDDLIAAWNFNDSLDRLGVSHGNGTLSHNLSNFDHTTAGSSLNRVGDDAVGDPIRVVGVGNDNAHMTFRVSMFGRENLLMSFASERSGGGPTANQVQYSLNGTDFTDFGATFDPSVSYSVITRDFSSVSAMTDAEDVYLRVRLGTFGSGGVIRFDNVQFRSRALRAFEVTDGQLASVSGATPLDFRFNVYDEISGLARGLTHDHGLGMTVTVPGLWTDDDGYHVGSSDADTTVSIAITAWRHEGPFSKNAITDMYVDGTFQPITATVSDDDFDRPDDNLVLEDQTFGNWRVVDNDVMPPELRNINWAGSSQAIHPFRMAVSNAFLSTDSPGTSNATMTVTDADLRNSGDRSLQLAFGVIDRGSGVSRPGEWSGIDSADTVLNISIGDFVAANYANYNAGLSSVNRTNAPTTNVWTFADDYFSYNMVGDMFASNLIPVLITLVDDDDHRDDDQAIAYNVRAGRIRVIDDDTDPPIMGALTLDADAEPHNLLLMGFENHQGWTVSSTTYGKFTNTIGSDVWIVNDGNITPLLTGILPSQVRAVGMRNQGSEEAWLQMPPREDPGFLTVWARLSGASNKVYELEAEISDDNGTNWVSKGTLVVPSQDWMHLVWPINEAGEWMIRIRRITDDSGPDPRTIHLDDLSLTQWREWSNQEELEITFNEATDQSGIYEYRVITTGGPEWGSGTNVSVGTTLGLLTDTTVAVPEGTVTGFVYAVDNDDDRPNDRLRNVGIPYVVRIDRTAPAQLAAPMEDEPDDPLTTIALQWYPALDPGDLPNEPLSPWDTYRVYFTDEVLDCADPLDSGYPCDEAALVAFFSDKPYLDASDDPDLGDMEGVYDAVAETNLVSTVIPDLVPGIDYTFAVAGRDRAGNLGPPSPPIVIPTQDFYITNAVAISATEARFEIRTAVGRNYDLMRVDTIDYGDHLTNDWVEALTFTGKSDKTRTINSLTLPFSFVTNSLPTSQARSQIRFIRSAPRHAWTNGRPFRIASSEVYLMKQAPVYSGQNWIAFPGIPDSNRVDLVLGTYLPAGGVELGAPRVNWFQRGGSNQVTTATNTIWLVNSDPPRWTTDGFDNANETELPLQDGFILNMPTNATPTNILLVGRIPLTNQVQTLSGSGHYNLIGARTPQSLHPSNLFSVADTNVGSGNFTGGSLPIPHPTLGSDMLWVYDRDQQRVRNVVYYNTADNMWRLDTGAVVPENYFRADDAIVFFSGRSTASITLTNHAALMSDGVTTNTAGPWSVPTINMTP